MIVFLAALLVFLFPAGAPAAIDRTGWSWERAIEAEGVSGFVRLPIPAEVFDRSQPGLDDLRVIDDAQAYVPHVVHWGRVQEREQTAWEPVRLLNPTYLRGRHARVTADFGKAVEKNQLKVGLSGENYRRRSLVEGSDDGASWEIVAENLWLARVSSQGQHFRIDTLKFPPNTFRYLRLTVFLMADDPDRIVIESVQSALSRTRGERELAAVAVKAMTVSSDRQARQTTLEMDLGFRNLPVSSIGLIIGSPYFFRGYELRGRNQAVERVSRKTETAWDAPEREVPWSFIQQGVIYRTQHQKKGTESTRIEPVRAPYRFLQFRIFNGDDPPLQFDGANVLRRDVSLVFQVPPGRVCKLIGGNPNAGPANYDLARAVEGVDDLRAPAVRLGPSSAVKEKEPLRPWTERHAAVLWAALILGVGVMLILIVRSLGKIRQGVGTER